MYDRQALSPDEFELKGPYWTTSVVNARLRTVFSAKESSRAAVVLAELVGEDPGGDAEVSDAASCRLMLAALKLSAGDLVRLAMWVEVGRNDPRDLIAAAEYSREAQGRSDAREVDLAEYLAWVNGVDAPGDIESAQ